MSRYERLQYLAETVSALYCEVRRDDGGDWEVGDEGFVDHAEECLRCLALYALTPDDEATP
jgi:hypothetical protein